MKRARLVNLALAAGLLAAALVVTCGPERGTGQAAPGAAVSDVDAAAPAATWLTPANRVALEPAAAVDASGRTWIAWLEYLEARGGSAVALVVGWRGANGELEVAFRSDAGLAAPAVPVLCALGDGVYLAYEGVADSVRGLFGRRLARGADGLTVGERERIAGGRALFPSVAETEPGTLGLVYQALVGTRYEIRHVARSGAGDWSAPRRVFPASGDAWRPRCASRGDGVLHVVADSFDGSRFVVDYAALDGRDEPEVLRVAGSTAYQGLPELALDGRGRTWIAWEEAEQFGEIGGLRAMRELRLAAVEDGAVAHVPASALAGPAGAPLRADFPRLACTDEGLLVTARTPGESWVPQFAREFEDFYSSWFTRVLSFDASGRAGATLLSDTDGDGEATELLLPARDGAAVVAIFAADLRTRQRPKPGAFEAAVESAWRLGAVELPAPGGFPPLVAQPVPSGREKAPAVAPPRAALDGARPLYGDLHRHTQLSRCQGTRDGTGLDAYRYARGPGGLDFVSITDHYQHLTPWSHWRALRDVERFHAPGSLVTFAGVERALRERAHVNEVFLATEEVPRQIAAFHREPDEPSDVPIERTLAIPHMMGMPAAPFPWKFFRDDLQRVIEVYQGLRGSYEGAGLPYEAMNRAGDDSSIAEGQRRGLHFGLIASSDHRASSTAYAGVWAEELTRESIFEALRARRTFGATARLSADARLGELAMGAEGSAPAEAALVVEVDGPAPVATVEVIKNGALFRRVEGDGNTELVVVSCRRYQALGSDPPERLEVGLRGGRILSATERMRGETGGRLELERGRVTLAKRIPWIDFVLEIEREASSAEGPVLELRLGELADEVRLDAIEPGRSIKHPEQLVRESIWRIGRPLAPAGGTGSPRSFSFEDPGRRAGDSYYARVAFTDGNLAWTSPIRVRAVAGE